MAVTLSLFAGAGAQFFDNNGNPLTGGKLYTYAAGTTTPLATYTTNSDASLHTNPIVLDAAGRVPSGGEIWLQLGVGYKFVLKTSTDVLIATYDNIPSSAQPPAANDADSIMYEQGYTVTAGSFVTGQIYRIVSVGTTDFTLIGAVANTVGLHFIATGAGTGTGTAELSRTVETKLREFVSVTDFGAVGDGVTDDYQAIQDAIDYLAGLSDPAHASSNPGSFNSPYGVSRVLNLAGLKYAISQGIEIKNSVSIMGNNGGFKALAGFPAGTAMLRSDGQLFGGRGSDIVIDGSGLDVLGLELAQCFNTRWHDIEIVNCRNDGISIVSGSEFFLDSFKISCADNPVTNAKGLRITTSDCHFVNGAVQFYPYGVWVQGGGNNDFVNIHAWGLYAGQKMQACFVVNGGTRNTFVGCYADSPTRADYNLAHYAPYAGYINGGFGWYIDANSDNNSLIGCRAFINDAEYTAAGLPAGQTLYPVGITNVPSNSEGNKIIDFNVGFSTHWYTTPYFAGTGVEIATYLYGYTGVGNWTPNSTESTAYQAAPSFITRGVFLTNQTGAVNLDLSFGTFFSVGKSGNITLTTTNVPQNRFGDGRVEVELFVFGTNTNTLTITNAVPPKGKTFVPTQTGFVQQYIRMFTTNGGTNWYVTDIVEY